MTRRPEPKDVLTPRRLCGGLLWSLCMARSQIARDVEVRMLTRRVAQARITGCYIVVGASPGYGRQPGRLQTLLHDWMKPTMTGKTGGILRPLALTLAELQVQPSVWRVCTGGIRPRRRGLRASNDGGGIRSAQEGPSMSIELITLIGLALIPLSLWVVWRA